MAEEKAKRGRYGAGSVYKTSKGEWRGSLPIRDPVTDRALPPKKFYGKTETEVKRKMREFQRSPEAVMQVSPSTMDAAKYFRVWLDTNKKKSLKQKSYDRLDSAFRTHIEPALECIQLRAVTPEDCDKLITDMKNAGKAHSTVKKVYDTLKEGFGYAVKKRDLAHSPMDTVVMPAKSLFPNPTKPEARALSVTEEGALLAELDRRFISSKAPVYRYKDVYILDLNTGLRLGEMVALDWSDVDFAKKRIHITKTAIMSHIRNKDGSLSGKMGQTIQEIPKTAKSIRWVQLNKEALAALTRLKDGSDGTGAVICTATGARVLMSTLEKQLKHAFAKCMITGASMHTLRHTFATRLFEKKAEVKSVSALLGHSSVWITYNTYIHVIEAQGASVVDLLDKDEA